MKKIMLLSSCYLLFSHVIFTSPSSLDTSFANNGATTNLFVSDNINQAQAIAVQANGKIVSAGYAGDNAIIIRYNNDGTLDTSFNGTGTVIVPGSLGTQSAAYGVAINPITQKIIIVGYVTIYGIDNAFIACYNHDGTLDTSFNDPNNDNTGSGYITTIFGAQSQLFGIKLQTDGSIVVVGWATYLGSANALVARYTAAGDLDTSFDTTGYTLTLIGGVFTKARAVDIQTDGKIVVAAQASIDGIQQLIIMRYTSAGNLDTGTFNAGGLNPGTNYPLSFTSISYGIALQLNQKIVVVGASNPFAPGFDQQQYTVVRFDTDGTLDETFNSNDTPGYVISDLLGLQANSVAIQHNGQIVTCGFNYSNNYIVVVVRFNSNGTIDPTFNFTVDSPEINTLAYAIALQIDGKIIVSGTRAIHFNQ
jgi:uncharacterized delta-60 repeat protein